MLKRGRCGSPGDPILSPPKTDCAPETRVCTRPGLMRERCALSPIHCAQRRQLRGRQFELSSHKVKNGPRHVIERVELGYAERRRLRQSHWQRFKCESERHVQRAGSTISASGTVLATWRRTDMGTKFSGSDGFLDFFAGYLAGPADDDR
jgi:hypothetical protein